jgi:hypothetical protein
MDVQEITRQMEALEQRYHELYRFVKSHRSDSPPAVGAVNQLCEPQVAEALQEQSAILVEISKIEDELTRDEM